MTFIDDVGNLANYWRVTVCKVQLQWGSITGTDLTRRNEVEDNITTMNTWAVEKRRGTAVALSGNCRVNENWKNERNIIKKILKPLCCHHTTDPNHYHNTIPPHHTTPQVFNINKFWWISDWGIVTELHVSYTFLMQHLVVDQWSSSSSIERELGTNWTIQIHLRLSIRETSASQSTVVNVKKLQCSSYKTLTQQPTTTSYELIASNKPSTMLHRLENCLKNVTLKTSLIIHATICMWLRLVTASVVADNRS